MDVTDTDVTSEDSPEKFAAEFADDAQATLGKAVIQDLRLSTLSVDPRVQRVLHSPRTNEIAKNFNPQAFGLPAVSKRDDGTNILIDGMHRVAALRKVPAAVRGGEDPMVKCETWIGLTLAEEAKIFVLRNKTEKVPALALFLVRVNGGDANAVAIRDLLSTYGWKAQGDRKNGTVNAIHTVEALWRANAWATTQAIETITQAWPNRPVIAMERHMIRGMTSIFAKYEGKVSIPRLVQRISKQVPDQIITAGAYHATMNKGVTKSKGVAYMVLDDYNKAPGANLNPRI